MATSSESVIVRGPDILSGQPFSVARASLSRLFSTTRRAEIRWMNSWNSGLVSPGSKLSQLQRKPKRSFWRASGNKSFDRGSAPFRGDSEAETRKHFSAS
jgi:hypothetical protein